MDRRRRNLILLGSAALVSVVLAGFALEERAAESAPRYTPTEVLPGFNANVKNADVIQITSHAGTFEVVGVQGKGWMLPGKNNYPANFDEVRHTLIGLAGLETIAPKTSHPEWLHYVSLDAPPKGNGTQITVKDAHGAVLASLILGLMEDLGDTDGTAGLFVRRPGDNQAWLARTVFTPHGDIASWLSPPMPALEKARVAEVAVIPAKGMAFTVGHGSAADQYSLANVPKQGTPNAQLIAAIPDAVTSLSFPDVRPAAGMDFAGATQVIARTFDGLQIILGIVQQGGDAWAKLAATSAPAATAKIVAEAAAINKNSADWAYKLPPDKAAALTIDLPKLMTPSPSPEAPPATVMPPKAAPAKP